MTSAVGHTIIAIEEHFMHEVLATHFQGGPHRQSPLGRKLYDFTSIRIEAMDQAGIDKQVLSHQAPGSQRISGQAAIDACRSVNDRLATAIRDAPDRFDGFAMLPTFDPEAAATELQRSVEDLGLKGAMIHGLSGGKFVDDPEFWPIYAAAEALQVPVYLHPAKPDGNVIASYLAPYDASHPDIIGPGWGFGMETGTQAVRMILSGVFDRHPGLQFILGHLGEALPFWLDRIDASFARSGNEPVRFAETFRSHFHITTSGFFSDAALRCCLEMLGPERILFAVDWPYADNAAAVDWLKAFPMDDAGKAAVFSGNAKTLLRL